MRHARKGWLIALQKFLWLPWCILAATAAWVLHSHAAPPLVSVGQNFRGTTYLLESGFSPPDANGAIGPLHFVEFINGYFSVYDRTSGTRVYGDPPETFWQRAGLDMGNFVSFDPRILFDPLTRRWFASALAAHTSIQASNHVLLGVSLSEDPSSGWRGIRLPHIEGRVADYPTLGMDAHRVHVAAYLHGMDGAAFSTNSLVSVLKSELMTSSVPSTVLFPPLRSATYGNVLQPAFTTKSGPCPVLSVEQLGWNERAATNIIAFRLEGIGLASPSFIPVSPFTRPPTLLQPGPVDFLSAGDNRFSGTVLEVGDVLYAVHSTRMGNRAALRWYRLDSSNLSLLESGDIMNDRLDYLYPSIAANAAGVVVVGFNACGPDYPISSFAVAGSTRNGVTEFGSPVLLQRGNGAFTIFSPSNGSIRWGDYSATSVDPIDPFRFWTIQMYTPQQDLWATQITEIATALPELGIHLLGTAVRLSWQGAEGAFAIHRTESLGFLNSWQKVSGEVLKDKGNWSVLLPLSSSQAFYKLVPAHD